MNVALIVVVSTFLVNGFAGAGTSVHTTTIMMQDMAHCTQAAQKAREELTSQLSAAIGRVNVATSCVAVQ
jgi:hypothetical protein